jgi:hypothetical protein
MLFLCPEPWHCAKSLLETKLNIMYTPQCYTIIVKINKGNELLLRILSRKNISVQIEKKANPHMMAIATCLGLHIQAITTNIYYNLLHHKYVSNYVNLILIIWMSFHVDICVQPWNPNLNTLPLVSLQYLCSVFYNNTHHFCACFQNSMWLKIVAGKSKYIKI